MLGQPAHSTALQHSPLEMRAPESSAWQHLAYEDSHPLLPTMLNANNSHSPWLSLQWYLWKNRTDNFVAVAVTAEASGMRSQVLMGTSPISDQKIAVKCVSPLFLLPGAILISRMKSELLLYNK